jgi:hypothetical protein
MLAMECLGLDGGAPSRDATSCGRVKEPGLESTQRHTASKHGAK